jgi:hypothetical protein
MAAAHAAVPGWRLGSEAPDDFAVALDRQIRHGGNASAAIWSVTPRPRAYATLVQCFLPDEYLGKRIRLSGWVKAADFATRANLWMRVESTVGLVTAFDDMSHRAANGMFDWTRQQIVLDVPRDSGAIYIGLMLAKGRAWLDDVSIELVGKTVRTTGTYPHWQLEHIPAGGRARCQHPALNLDFEQ